MSSDFIRISDHRIRKDDIASYGISRQGATASSTPSNSAPAPAPTTAAARYLYIHTQQQSFRFSDDELDLSDTLTLLDRLLLGGR